MKKNTEMQLSSRAPPTQQCWVYSLSDEVSSNQDMETAKVYDLESQQVDPLESLIGFYSVVGRKSMQPEHT